MITSIAEEVLQGLTRDPKSISSKFLYDEKGSSIFEQITAMPSYYLYNAEFEILRSQGENILNALPFTKPFSIVEFGAGDGTKTLELLKKIRPHHGFEQYIPVDISPGANGTLHSNIRKTLPNVPVSPIHGNYLTNMKSLIPESQPVLLLFLGSNIGNFHYTTIRKIIRKFSQSLKKGDAALIGFDLRKNPLVIRQAYDDPEGITRSFNMNLLTRFNRDIGADFNLNQFDFYSYYHPESGEVRSFLVSLVEQTVFFRAMDQTIEFSKDELIQTEISKKFDLDEIYELMRSEGFRNVDHWRDSDNYFADVLAVK